jgi:hypothetical protein
MKHKLIVTVDNAIAKWCKVTLDGIDVTNDCFIADEFDGRVGLYKKNQDGKRYLEDGDAAREYKTGKVEIALIDDAPYYAKKLYFGMRGQEL